MGQWFLRVVSGPRQGLSVPLRPEQPLLIGRSKGDLLLDDALISSSHCRIVFKNDRFYLQDLGSTNGTHIGRRRVTDEPVDAGQELLLGETRLLVFEAEDVREEATSPDSRVAWLLDEEIVREPATGEPTLAPYLQLPLRFDARLDVIAGPDQGKIFKVHRGTMAIGRRQGEIPLTDLEISRRHAILEVFGPDMVFLRDDASTNGTYHNARRVQMARLANHDTVGCGKSVLRLVIG